MIKVVSFDIGGTLIINQDSGKYSFTELSKLINRDNEEVKHAYQDVFQKRKGNFDELVNLFCKQLNIKVNSDIKEFFTGNFNQKCYFDNNSIPVIKKLKEMGYQVILFSNTSNLYTNGLDEEIEKIVDYIFYSYKISHTKDERESYRYIEKKMNCEAHEFLHIGDSFENDYLYPIKNGWNALLYGKNDNARCLSDFSEIFDYLSDFDN